MRFAVYVNYFLAMGLSRSPVIVNAILSVILCLCACGQNPSQASSPIIIDLPAGGPLHTGVTTLAGHAMTGRQIDSGTIEVNGYSTELWAMSDTSFERVVVLEHRSNTVRLHLRFIDGGSWETELTIETDDSCGFLSNALLDSAISTGIPVNAGSNPWNIEGNYFANSLDWTRSNYGSRLLDTLVATYSFRFGEQSSNLALKVDQLAQSGGDSIEGGKAFLTGTGNRFSLFFFEDHIFTDSTRTIPVVWARILSATITTQGLVGCHIGAILSRKENDPNHTLIPVGSVRLYVETDSLAQRVSTYPFVEKAKHAAAGLNTIGGDE